MAAVFMRTEPPVDQAYLTATYVLDLIDPARTPVVNDPRGLRECSEHLLGLQFPDLCPPTIVTASQRTIREFLAEYGTAVIKPADGFSGREVLRLDQHDPNLASLIEISTRAGSRAVVVQRHQSEVSAGNKRIFVVVGEPAGAVYRFPQEDDFRIGNPTAQAPVTARDREICSQLAPTLRSHGIHLAGLDVIGSYLIEVNVTSVGALRMADAGHRAEDLLLGNPHVAAHFVKYRRAQVVAFRVALHPGAPPVECQLCAVRDAAFHVPLCPALGRL